MITVNGNAREGIQLNNKICSRKKVYVFINSIEQIALEKTEWQKRIHVADPN